MWSPDRPFPVRPVIVSHRPVLQLDQEAPAGRIDRRVSPIWTTYELHNGAGQRPAVVQLACYYGRSTGGQRRPL
jgi:hypothetical protein